MKGNAEVISALNDILTGELAAINQYFLHARILEDWGLKRIGSLEYKASIDEMKHADELIKRVLFLEGLPNVQKIGKVNIGQNVKEILECDKVLEEQAIPKLKKYIELCESVQDYVSRDLLSSILDSEEEHLDWLETELSLYNNLGEQNYIQSQLEKK